MAGFPHAVPPGWYGRDSDRLLRFAAQLDTLPVPPKTVVIDRYKDLSTGTGSGGDFHHFVAGRTMRTHLSIHEIRRFYGGLRYRSALATLPFDGTTEVPVEVTHDGRLDKEGKPKPGGMIVHVEIHDIAQDNFVRSQRAP